MRDLFVFLLVLAVTNAALYNNQTNNPTKSFEIAFFPEDDGYPISHRQDLFIDCSSYSSWLLASAATAATAGASTTGNLATSTVTNPVISSPTVPFEQYWCENFDETTEVGGSIGPWLYGINASEKEYCLSLEKSNYSSWAAEDPTLTTIGQNHTTFMRSPSLWVPTLTQPCCGTLCNIVASAVQLYFWPTPAPYPNISTMTGSDGFVYTSPSVYVVYKNLHATGQCGILGPSYSRITLSYHQTDLSTNVNFLEGIGPAAINYADLFTNCTNPETVQGYGLNDVSDTSYDNLHCSPRLQMPAGLQSVNPRWSTCVDTMEADDDGFVNDPPRALIPGAALGPAQTKDVSPTTTAAPVSIASQPVPRKTTPPSTLNAISGPSNNLAKQNPAGNDPTPGNISPDGGSLPVEDPPSGTSNSALENKAPQGNDPPAKADPSAGINSPASTNMPTGDSATAGKDISVEHDQLSGNDPHAGNDLPYSNSLNLDSSADNNPTIVEALLTTTMDGHVVQAVSSTIGVLVDGQYIARGGGSITIFNTPIALHSNGDLVFGTSTVQKISPNPAPFITTIKGHVLQATPIYGDILVDGISVSRGGNSITISGTLIALHEDGNLVMGTSTVQGFLSSLNPVIATVFTAAGQPLTIFPNHVAIAGTILTANAPAITLAGTLVSLGTDSLVVGTSTILLPSLLPASIINIAGHTYAISRATNGVLIAGTTLQIGQSAITISGTPVVLESSGLVIDGTSTVRYQSIVGASPISNPVGDFILAGLDTRPTPSQTMAASGAANQTLDNTTRPADSVINFQGRGGRVSVPLYYPAAVTATMLLGWFLRTEI